MQVLNDPLIVFEKQCVIDQAKVFYMEDKVYRAVYNPTQAKLYERLFNEIDFEPLFEAGLVRTKINKELTIPNCHLILEHEKIDFFIDPSEMTNSMFWDAAKSYIQLNKLLAEYNLILKDSHPWNITFHKGKPVFFDFSSISFSKVVTSSWFTEFYTYFGVPIALAHSKWSNLANEYRKQHLSGFGLKLSEHPLIKKYLFRSFIKLSKLQNEPVMFFTKLNDWISKYPPVTSKGKWDNYDQKHESDFDKPSTVKQKFVYNILEKEKPTKVADLATNKGYFAFMAENLGAKVIGFDYEEFSVDAARNLITDQNISFCQMNFMTPTARRGWGLVIPDAFQRFHSDISLALGLIHHVCLVQRFPVQLFCDSCARYADNGVILEFVYPEDLHVKTWNVDIPHDYNKKSICNYFSKYFDSHSESDLVTEGGIMRQFLFFSNNPD